jgi:hypothetical protein
MDVRPVADDDQDEQQNRHDEESGGLGGVNGMAVAVLVAGNVLLRSRGRHGGILVRSVWGGHSCPPNTKRLHSERTVNNPLLIRQIEIPLTFHVHAPHRLLAYDDRRLGGDDEQMDNLFCVAVGTCNLFVPDFCSVHPRILLRAERGQG